MANFQLKAVSALGGYQQQFATLNLSEVTDLSIVSIASVLAEEDSFQQQMQHSYAAQLKQPGMSIEVSNSDQLLQFWSMSSDQRFVMATGMAHSGPQSLMHQLQQALGECCYYFEQSDAWVALRLQGEGTRSALERICPLNLQVHTFKVGDVARTSMEHLGVLIRRESDDSYLLLSARSSAQSFLHALQVSIVNTQ